MKVMTTELEEKNNELKAREVQLQAAEEEFKRCEQQLRETRVSREELLNLKLLLIRLPQSVLISGVATFRTTSHYVGVVQVN